MKKSKLIGATLMSSAILLQVGYAASTTVEHTISNTQKFDVYFSNPVITEASEQVQVTVQENSNTLDIQVGNIYPGAVFDIVTNVQNYGEITARIKGISLEVLHTPVDGMEYNQELMNMLVGYDEQGNRYAGQNEYTQYLIKTYTGYEIPKGKSIPIKFSIGMSPEVEDLQNQVVDFAIKLDLEQVIPPGPGPDPDPDPDPNPDPDPDPEIPDEIIPGGEVPDPDPEVTNPEVDVPDETLPGGETIVPDKGTEEVDITEEAIPGGKTETDKKGLLPQTGGITPTLVYSIGFAMLAGGLVIYRKKED